MAVMVQARVKSCRIGLDVVACHSKLGADSLAMMGVGRLQRHNIKQVPRVHSGVKAQMAARAEPEVVVAAWVDGTHGHGSGGQRLTTGRLNHPTIQPSNPQADMLQARGQSCRLLIGNGGLSIQTR
jgi:hypothetical protein